MVINLLGNGSVTIAQEDDLGTWEVSTKRNFAIINKINNIFRIFRDSTFSVVAALGR